MRKFVFFLIIFFISFQILTAQQWVEMLSDKNVNFYEVQKKFYDEWGEKPYVRGQGWKQFKRWEYFIEPRVFPSGKMKASKAAWEEYFKIKEAQKLYTMNSSANWSSLGPNQWESTSYNPGNGRINVVVRDPVDENTLYIGTPAGGCWKSLDDGNTWVNLTDDLPVLGVSGIAVNPTNNQEVYIATGDGDGWDTYSLGVFKSEDGGATWTALGLNWNFGLANTTRKLVFHPTNTDILFLVTNVGLYKTTNGGANWVLKQNGSMRDIEFHPNNPDIVYLCSDRFYRSTDGGENFTFINSGGIPVPSQVNRMAIGVSPNQPDWVYILMGDDNDSSFKGLYRSTDSGLNFNLQTDTPNMFSYSQDGSGEGGQSWYDMALAVHPENAQEVVIGGINVWKSTNGGSNFNILTHWVYPANIGYVHADIHALEYLNKEGTTRLFCGSDGGLFVSEQADTSWIDKSPGLEITQFYRIDMSQQDPGKIIGGTQDNGTNLLEDGIWTHIQGGDGMGCLIDYTNDDILYASFQYGTIRKSINGGQDLVHINNGLSGDGAWVTPYVMHPTNSNTLYVGYEDVFRTDDGGDNFYPISDFGSGASLRVLAVAPSNPDYIYVANNDVMRRTKDGGNTWTTLNNGLPSESITYFAIHPDNPEKIWATFSGFTSNLVFTSSNAGDSWNNYSQGLPSLPANCIVYQNGSPNGLYIGTDVGIYYRDSTLANWQPYNTNLPNVIVNDLKIDYGIQKIRAATYGRGLWESDLYQPSTVPPLALFDDKNLILCEGDSAQFFDQSLNAAPVWEWHFENGSPATSGSRNPKVVFSDDGDHLVTLIVQNQNGYDTISQTVNIQYGQNEFILELDMDDNGHETSWEVLDANGDVAARGGPYPDVSIGINVIEKICLLDGCYKLRVLDSGGDGMCCDNGNGSYTFTDQFGVELATGGDFNYQSETNFCGSITTVLAAFNVDKASCNAADGVVTINAVGGDMTYFYSLDAGNNFQTENIFEGIPSGTYFAQVVDGGGYIYHDTIFVEELEPPLAFLQQGDTTIYLTNGGVLAFEGFSLNADSVVWHFGDGNISNEYFTIHGYTSPGVYEVDFIALGGNCSDSLSFFVTVELEIGINNLYENNFIKIHPNPFRGKSHLSFVLPERQDVSLEIHDAKGRNLMQRELKNIKNYSELIDFKTYYNGIYFIKLKTKEKTYSKKIIKTE